MIFIAGKIHIRTGWHHFFFLNFAKFTVTINFFFFLQKMVNTKLVKVFYKIFKSIFNDFLENQVPWVENQANLLQK